jgi:hypothetical protein
MRERANLFMRVNAVPQLINWDPLAVVIPVLPPPAPPPPAAGVAAAQAAHPPPLPPIPIGIPAHNQQWLH